MSQTETLLFVLAGFSLAALLFLFLARTLWHAGVKLGARRMRKQVPANVAELQSDRDSLRADYARLSQKLGSRLEQSRLQMAEQMAEVARHRNRISGLVSDLNGRDAEIADLRLRVESLESDLERRSTRASEAEKDAESAQAEAEQLRAALSGATAEAEQLRGEILSLEAKLEAEAANLAAIIPAPDRLKQRIDHLAELSHEIAAERTAAMPADQSAAPDTLLQENLDAVERETADLQQELARLDAAWAEKLDVEPPGPAEKPAVANVVNLAQRIRALQHDISRKKASD